MQIREAIYVCKSQWSPFSPQFLPLTALAETLFVQLLLPVLHQQKQRDGWPSVVVLEAVAGGG